jgi:hypothetical protein
MAVLNAFATFWALRAAYLALNPAPPLAGAQAPEGHVSGLEALDAKASAR